MPSGWPGRKPATPNGAYYGLSVSYERLGDVQRAQGDLAGARDWWRKAYDTLAGMKQRGIMLPTDERYFAELRRKV